MILCHLRYYVSLGKSLRHEIILICIDYSEPFENVSNAELLNALKHMRFPIDSIVLLQSMHTNHNQVEQQTLHLFNNAQPCGAMLRMYCNNICLGNAHDTYWHIPKLLQL